MRPPLLPLFVASCPGAGCLGLEGPSMLRAGDPRPRTLVVQQESKIRTPACCTGVASNSVLSRSMRTFRHRRLTRPGRVEGAIFVDQSDRGKAE
jgi:hypothetical protein